MIGTWIDAEEKMLKLSLQAGANGVTVALDLDENGWTLWAKEEEIPVRRGMLELISAQFGELTAENLLDAILRVQGCLRRNGYDVFVLRGEAT